MIEFILLLMLTIIFGGVGSILMAVSITSLIDILKPSDPFKRTLKLSRTEAFKRKLTATFLFTAVLCYYILYKSVALIVFNISPFN